MKTLLLAVTATALLCLTSSAQIPSQSAGGSTAGGGQTSTSAQMDGLVKQGPRVVLMRSGRSTLLDKSLTLPNGVRVDPDGTITRPDRSQAMLQPNQMLTLAGKLVPLPPGTASTPATSGDGGQITVLPGDAPASPIKAGEGTGAR